MPNFLRWSGNTFQLDAFSRSAWRLSLSVSLSLPDWIGGGAIRFINCLVVSLEGAITWKAGVGNEQLVLSLVVMFLKCNSSG